jgi:hypothetical protein
VEDEAVRVHVQPEYFDGSCPYPVAFLWIDGEMFDAYPCGTVHRRVKWLPLWFPFNARYSYSFYSQLACVQMLREFGERLREDMVAMAVARDSA